MRGQCLCGTIEFEVAASRLKLYRCHCSLCRKQSGTSSNCAAVVEKDDFRWLRGQETATSWKRSTGYRSDFCSRCGSPVPNELGSSAAYWVPAGLLEDTGQIEVIADFHLSSKASWDTTPPAMQQFAELPSIQEFFSLLHND
jgi:hypothetical protein